MPDVRVLCGGLSRKGCNNVLINFHYMRIEREIRGIIMKKRVLMISAIIFIVALSLGTAFAQTETTSKYTGLVYTHDDKFSDRMIVNGVDVSAWQENIDWEKVKADGIDFAIIRVGGRGYGAAGSMYSDECYIQNIENAKKAGLIIGIYYFSQAISEDEAVEEAQHALSLLGDYDIQLPIFMDYEYAKDPQNPGRLNTANLSKEQMTKNAEAFCKTVEDAGYEAGVYANLNFLNNSVHGQLLGTKYFIWAAQYYNKCEFEHTYDIWQYSSSGSVDGINTRADCDFWYLDKTPSPTQEKSIANCRIKVSDVTYKPGSNHEPQVEVTYNGINLREGVDYKVGYINNREAGTAYAFVSGTGEYADHQAASFKISAGSNTPEKIDIAAVKINLQYSSVEYDGTAKTPKVTVSGLTEGKDFRVKYADNVNIGTAKVTINGIGNYTGAVTKTFTIAKPSGTSLLLGNNSQLRIYGQDRYDTSLKAADNLKRSMMTSKFDTIIVASGNDYADALSGTYLAKIKDAPILVTGRDAASQKKVKSYIYSNLKSGGKVYILGGNGAVSSEFEKGLEKYDVRRLWGATRFETNIAILKECGVKNEDILVCSGTDFADSLSASAVGKPILLVNKNLSSRQKSYLSGLKSGRYYIIGGPGAVSSDIVKEIAGYGTVDRIYGQNRYSTSVAVAKRFFGKDCEAIVLTYGLSFPDGLSGGVLAMSLETPLILATSKDVSYAASYAKEMKIGKAVVLGGSALISNNAVNKII